MELIILCLEFFKIGLFSIGGGLATIPFLMELANRYPWFSTEMLSKMIAISESTPGPIGINMATYAGYHAAGIIGGILAPIALVLPSIIIIVMIAKALQQFRNNQYVKHLFAYLKPTSLALLAAVGITLVASTLFTIEAVGTWAFFRGPSIFIYCILLPICFKKQYHPIVFLGITMILGIILKL